MDLLGAEDIKKRWQEYTKNYTKKKDLNDPENHDGITNLEPDILQCEASGHDEIPDELFQI